MITLIRQPDTRRILQTLASSIELLSSQTPLNADTQLPHLPKPWRMLTLSPTPPFLPLSRTPTPSNRTTTHLHRTTIRARTCVHTPNVKTHYSSSTRVCTAPRDEGKDDRKLLDKAKVEAELHVGFALITTSLLRVIRQVQPPSYAALLFGVHALCNEHASTRALDTLQGHRVTDRIDMFHMLWAVSFAEAAYCETQAQFCESTGIREQDVIRWQAACGALRPAHFIALDHNNEDIVVGIRGTHTVLDISTAFTGCAEPIAGGQSHQGMLAAAKWLLWNEFATLVSLVHDHPNYSICLTGHSMGAGTAALISFIINSDRQLQEALLNVHVRCVGVATPPVLTRHLAESAASHTSTVVLQHDAVCRMSVKNVQRLMEEVASVDSSQDIIQRAWTEWLPKLDIYALATALPSNIRHLHVQDLINSLSKWQTLQADLSLPTIYKPFWSSLSDNLKLPMIQSPIDLSFLANFNNYDSSSLTPSYPRNLHAPDRDILVDAHLKSLVGKLSQPPQTHLLSMLSAAFHRLAASEGDDVAPHDTTHSTTRDQTRDQSTVKPGGDHGGTGSSVVRDPRGDSEPQFVQDGEVVPSLFVPGQLYHLRQVETQSVTQVSTGVGDHETSKPGGARGNGQSERRGDDSASAQVLAAAGEDSEWELICGDKGQHFERIVLADSMFSDHKCSMYYAALSSSVRTHHRSRK